MKKGTYIGIKDRKGKKLYVGDYVQYPWGWFTWKGETKAYYQIHKLRFDKKDKRVVLGDSYNKWKGKDAQRTTRWWATKHDITLQRDFFFDDNVPTMLTGGHCFGDGTPEGKAKWDKDDMEWRINFCRQLFLGSTKDIE